ncbi:preprotein translocase subunit YajC [Thalassoroseus pseudoceratinae]|uniref:preprotein translocase subunit YajC n=1 Tax=Thalassoroseus pseudoceratinae TaxID=2713176 RepID=UPI00141DDDC0|nr:preprotein translocase subunit YajC [Thalassoroseus pseudoceratinae]
MFNLAWFSTFLLLAEEAANKPNAPEPPNLLMWMFPFLAIMILFQFMFSPQKKEQKRVEQLKSSLKKNDSIVTAGGILGTIVQVHTERDEATVKVDENTRLRMKLGSIYAAGSATDSDKKSDTESK